MALSVKRDVYLDIMYHLFANPTISSANLGQSLEHTHTVEIACVIYQGSVLTVVQWPKAMPGLQTEGLMVYTDYTIAQFFKNSPVLQLQLPFLACR